MNAKIKPMPLIKENTTNNLVRALGVLDFVS
jgi:hypothetical protein